MFTCFFYTVVSWESADTLCEDAWLYTIMQWRNVDSFCQIAFSFVYSSLSKTSEYNW